MVRAAEGVKATGAYRSRKQLGCYELAATPASIGLPAPRSLYDSATRLSTSWGQDRVIITSKHQGSSWHMAGLQRKLAKERSSGRQERRKGERRGRERKRVRKKGLNAKLAP